jgi:predicted RNA binding protein YcfA (HicA-like mRNA interferase family)
MPRDFSGAELTKLLSEFGYKIIRQTGSHIT